MTESLPTLLNLAYIYLNYGKTKRAIDYLLIANRVSPDNLQVMKMQIAAFRDIKAYPQALTLIERTEQRTDLGELDQVTLKLMKSLCLKGNNQFEEGKKCFNDYLSTRKQLATKKYWERIKRRETRDENIILNNFSIEDDMENFVKKGQHIISDKNMPDLRG